VCLNQRSRQFSFGEVLKTERACLEWHKMVIKESKESKQAKSSDNANSVFTPMFLKGLWGLFF